MLKNTETGYGGITKFFHWLIAILMIGMLIFGYFLSDFHNDDVYNIHKLIGLSILTLVALRILWTLHTGRPKLDTLPKWEKMLAYSTEGLLYLGMVCMPLFGWLGVSFYNRPPHLFGVNLGLPLTPNPTYGSLFINLHGDVAVVLIVLISLHVLGALKHFLIDKDRILQKMLPFTSNE